MTSNPLAGIWERLPNEQASAKPRASPPWPLSSVATGSASSIEPRRDSSPHPSHTYSASPRSSVSSTFSATPSASASPSRPDLALPSGLPGFSDPVSPGARSSPKAHPSDSGVFSGLAFLAGREKDFGVASFNSPSPNPATPLSGAPASSGPGPTPTAALASPPLPAEPQSEHTQLALAEIFAGNPRPNFRSPSTTHSGGLADGAPLRPDLATETSRGYFSAPVSAPQPPTRTRSLSSAPDLDRNAFEPLATQSQYSTGGTTMSGRSSSQQPDQYGYRPSGSSAYSSSLPAMSNPIRIAAAPPSRNDDSGPRLPGFGAASYTGGGSSIDPTGWRNATDQRQGSFGRWDEREGRGRSRGEVFGERDGSSSSGGTGIGVSNMSPFTRDGGRVLSDLVDNATTYRSRREYSLGAVGSGRKRGDTVWGSSRPLREDDDEDDDAFAPTRSGATSRRHSVAAFNPPSRSQIGFALPDEAANKSEQPSSANGGRSLATRGTFGMGSSAIDDDDLVADLNSLHLNLEAHAAATDQQASRAFAPVGSVPSNYPQSRPYDTTSRPPPTGPFSPPNPDPFSPSLGGSGASRFFQPPASNGPRGASRFEFGSVGIPATSAPGQDFALPSFRNPPLPQPQQQAQDRGRYAPSFGLPPSPPSSFRSSLTPLSTHGLSAQAPAFQTFSPTPSQSSSAHHQSFYSSSSPAMQQPQSGPDLSNLGRGIPLHTVPANAPLYIVEFKAGRKDLFFVEDPNLQLRQGDLVIVEADRGKDIGKFFKPCSLDEVQAFQQRLVEVALGQLANPAGGAPPNPATIARMTKEFAPKKIFGKAQASDTQMLLSKAQDEVKALALIRTKVAQKNLAMEVCDAEWQWDRRKLTFYFTLLPGHARVDFRELVRELFRIYKTRLWLCSLDQSASAWDFK